MSPSESQLRAALREGEGEVPNAGTVIAGVARLRYERRRRYTAVVGGVAAAAIAGVGVTLLVGLNSGSDDSGGANSAAGGAMYADRAAAASSTAAGAGRAPGKVAGAKHGTAAPPSAASAPSGSTRAAVIATDLTCPQAADRLMLPGGGGIGSFGSTGDLFEAPVSAARVCAYPLRAGAQVRSVVLVGEQAASVAETLEAAPAKQSHAVCASRSAAGGGSIEVLPVDAQGTALKPVVITIGCPNSRVTNGTAARFPAAVPAVLRGLLSAVPGKSPMTSPSR